MILQGLTPKDPSKFTNTEKEIVTLDISLQLIIVESLDDSMYNHVVNCKTSKNMWETIEIICEGMEEVRENRLKILTSAYEAFKSNLGEGISELFERYNKLINDLNLHDKFYTKKEVNRKFMLNLPIHLEDKISSIREAKDMSVILDIWKLKTYELELKQRNKIYGISKQSHKSTALVAIELMIEKRPERKIEKSMAKAKEVFVAELDDSKAESEDENNFYTL